MTIGVQDSKETYLALALAFVPFSLYTSLFITLKSCKI